MTAALVFGGAWATLLWAAWRLGWLDDGPQN